MCDKKKSVMMEISDGDNTWMEICDDYSGFENIVDCKISKSLLNIQYPNNLAFVEVLRNLLWNSVEERKNLYT